MVKPDFSCRCYRKTVKILLTIGKQLALTTGFSVNSGLVIANFMFCYRLRNVCSFRSRSKWRTVHCLVTRLYYICIDVAFQFLDFKKLINFVIFSDGPIRSRLRIANCHNVLLLSSNLPLRKYQL